MATIADIKKTTDEKMKKSLESLKQDLAKVRTGRAHTGLIENIQVDYYGSMMALNQVANLNLIDARTISVTPWEKKLIGNIEKAIRESDLGLNPATQGDLIRVPMPLLTEERRKEMVKMIKVMGEDSRVIIRNLRRDANTGFKELLKAKAVSEDEDRRAQDDIQKLTDKFIADIDKMLVEKEKEVLTV
jgi:ribosome recycling factor